MTSSANDCAASNPADSTAHAPLRLDLHQDAKGRTGVRWSLSETPRRGENTMQAWINFLTTDYGILSLLSIAAMLCGLGYFLYYVSKHVKEDTERHDKLLREAGKL
jgi:hypothetical protein